MSVVAKNISVVFPGIRALDDINMEFEPGKIHAVLGANGSGKSTFVKVMTGIYTPQPGGEIQIGPARVDHVKSPNHARELGIKVVHQEAPLINTVTVAESVALFNGYPRTRLGLIDWKKLYAYCRDIFGYLNIEVDPRAYVADLSASERAMVSIAIALGTREEAARTRLLILDEADASIPEDEAAFFLEKVRLCADMGIPVIIVTHRLNSIRSICDWVYILNNGRLVYAGAMAQTDNDFIVGKMLPEGQGGGGAEAAVNVDALWSAVHQTPHAPGGGPVYEVRDLAGAGTVGGISFTVDAGEILGIVGITGSGVTELPLLLGGDIPRSSGEILVDGKPLGRRLTPGEMIRKGVCLVPSDRFRQGGAMNLTLKRNLLMPQEENFTLKFRYADRVTAAALEVLDVRPPRAEMEFGKFSGGNQQKAIVAKWLLMNPKLLILDDPTYGVDPAARLKIFSAIRSAAEKNTGIIVFSTEPEQLSMLCSRVLILRRGEIVHTLTRKDGTLSRQSIAGWCYA